MKSRIVYKILPSRTTEPDIVSGPSQRSRQSFPRTKKPEYRRELTLRDKCPAVTAGPKVSQPDYVSVSATSLISSQASTV